MADQAPHNLPGLPDVELAQVHVVFRCAAQRPRCIDPHCLSMGCPGSHRHGARAPLSTKHGSGEAVWNMCSGTAQAGLLPVAVQSLVSAAPPSSEADARQRAATLPGGCHLGQLTDLGVRQALALGAALRERYVPALLPPDALPCAATLSVRSSNLQRTVATARGVLSGLYPAAAAQPRATPVAVRVAPDATEWLFPNTAACARLRDLWAQRSAAWDTTQGDAAWRSRFAPQLQHIHTALPPHHQHALQRAWGVVELLDHATSRQAHGLPPLGALTAAHTDSIRDIASAIVSDMFTGGASNHGKVDATALGLRLSVGRVLADVSGSMEARASHRSQLRMRLFAAHDTTVLPLLLALSPQGESHTWPPYASALTLELWAPKASTEGVASSTSGEHYVRALYQGRLLRMPCSEQAHGACTLSSWLECVAPLLPRDWHKDCRVDTRDDSSD